MGVVQLSLLTLGLMVCSYDSALEECINDQGVITVLEVISQLSENGGISGSLRNDTEMFLIDICRQGSSRFPQLAGFVLEDECIDAVMRAMDRIPNNTNINSFESLREGCNSELFFRGWLNGGLLGFGVFILIVLSFMKKRHHFAKDKCDGYPGVIIPVNLLHSMHSHFIYVVIFGAMASDILSNIFNPSTDFIADGYDTVWTSPFIFYAQVLLQAVYFSPLLACVHAPFKFLGYSLGLLYSAYFVSIRLYHLRAVRSNCVFFRGDFSHLYPLVELPTYICLLIVFTWYAFQTVISAYEMYQWFVNRKLPRKRGEQRPHQYILRVKKLLMRSPQGGDTEEGKGNYGKLVTFIQKYTCDSSFNYPLGFSSAVLITMICIFELTFLLVLITWEGVVWLYNSLNSVRELLELLESSIVDIDFYRYFRYVALFLRVMVPTVPIIAAVFCYVLLFLLVINVRKDIKRLYAGDFSFLPKRKPAPANMLASGVRYMGYQVGYFVWTWVIALLVLYVVVLLVFIYLLLMLIDYNATLNWTIAIIIPTVVSTAFRYGQKYFAQFVFLQDRGVTLTLTNIQGFHWFKFMMIFFNVVVGLTSALLRNIFSLVFGLLLMPRLDRTVLMKGFARFDSGYKTYIGFLYLNLYHNNPVVNTFCLLLYATLHPMSTRESRKNAYLEWDDIIITQLNATIKSDGKHEVKSKLSFNRWLVAYTLIKNPQLQELRAHCIAAKKTDDAVDQMVMAEDDRTFNNETNINDETVIDEKESRLTTTV